MYSQQNILPQRDLALYIIIIYPDDVFVIGASIIAAEGQADVNIFIEYL